jgi:hypothetical protein
MKFFYSPFAESCACFLQKGVDKYLEPLLNSFGRLFGWLFHEIHRNFIGVPVFLGNYPLNRSKIAFFEFFVS